MECIDINWNAVAAIGTCAGAVASFLTVLFAILSNRKLYKQTSAQIRAMVQQLNYLNEQNYIAKSTLEEAKKQTELAKEELITSVAELKRNRDKVPEIRVSSIDKLNENIEIQNRLLGIICNHYRKADNKEHEGDTENAN